MTLMTDDPIASARDLHKEYGKDEGLVRAGDGIKPRHPQGETRLTGGPRGHLGALIGVEG